MTRAAFFRRIVFTSLAIAALPSSQAHAQADPNIDSRIESVLPQEHDLLSPAEVVQQGFRTEIRDRTPAERITILDRMHGMRTLGFEKLSPEAQMKLLDKLVPVKGPVQVPNLVPKPRKTEFKLTPSVSYSYESNATRARINRVEDQAVGLGLLFSAKVPVGTDPDAVTFSVSAASARYDKTAALNFDTVASSVKYAKLIGKTPYTPPSPGTAHNIADVLITGFDTRSAFTTTFERNTLNFYFPSIVWSRQGMPVGDSVCRKGKDSRYCLLMDTTVGLQHTFFDQPNRDFTLAELGATIYSLDIIKDAKVSFGAGVGYKQFVDFPGDRTDWIYTINAAIEKTIGKGTLSGSVGYISQDSTFLNANYRGATIKPMLKLVIPLN